MADKPENRPEEDTFYMVVSEDYSQGILKQYSFESAMGFAIDEVTRNPATNLHIISSDLSDGKPEVWEVWYSVFDGPRTLRKS